MKPAFLTTISLAVLALVAVFVLRPNHVPETQPLIATVIEQIKTNERTQGVESDPRLARYENQAYKFSFEKPEGYTVGAVTEGESEVILVQSEDGDSKNDFQIFISPLSGPLTLTPQFIQQELPGTVVAGAKKIVLDGTAEGIMFASNNPAFGGSSYEIWFVHGGRIYQASSYAVFAPQLQHSIGTWKFQ